MGKLVVVEDEVMQLGHAAEGVVGDARQPVAVEVKGAEVFQILEGMRRNCTNGIPRKGQVNQFGHVGEVFAFDAGYKVVP